MPKSSKSSYAQAYVTTKKNTQHRIRSFLDRRPHRSFQRTRRRDYVRPLKLPGFIAFNILVTRTLLQFKNVFIWLIVVYAALTIVFLGLGSQQAFSTLSETLQDTGSEIFEGNIGELGKAGLLFVSVATTGLSVEPSEIQQLLAVIFIILAWLTTVWLLRNLLAGHKVRFRDGLYSAGAPIVPTVLLSLLLLVQFLPLALAVIGYGAALASGLLDNGVEAMLFWFAAGFLTVLSLYWATSTFFALIIVTLPGMYPLRALRTAGDIVLGRRVPIFLRLVWMSLSLILFWAIFLIPIILLMTFLGNVWPIVQSIPVVPVVLVILSSLSVLWSAAYIYLLYRKVVDNDAA